MTTRGLLAINFATEGPYQAEQDRLRASCEKFGITLHAEVISSVGDWRSNCAYKARFCQYMMQCHPDKTLLWLDADAEIVAPIEPMELTALPCDIAVRFRRWGKPNPRDELMSGTIVIQPSDKAFAVITRWVNLQANSRDWDQRVLDEARKQVDCRVWSLDPRYCAIFDEGMADPIVVHHQASRRLKRAVNAAPRTRR